MKIGTTLGEWKMIRVLFLYRYGILGGVCTQIHHRLLKLKDSPIEVHCGFMSNQGAEEAPRRIVFLALLS